MGSVGTDGWVGGTVGPEGAVVSGGVVVICGESEPQADRSIDKKMVQRISFFRIMEAPPME